jgi:inner membrane protein
MLRTSAMARLAVMAVLLFGLLVPVTMIYALVHERMSRRDESSQAISGEWGGRQVLGGPVLSVPYTHTWVDSSGNVRERTERVFALPEILQVQGDLEPAVRSRGVFDAVVYTARLRVTGRFANPDLSAARPAPQEILWDQATVHVGVADPKGIAERVSLVFDGREVPFVPGVVPNGLFATGVHAAAPGLAAGRDTPLAFEFVIDLNGTTDFRLLPGGDETVVQLASSWPHPSFTGSPLPRERTTGPSGFTATWRVPYFGRGFGSRWTGEDAASEQLRTQAGASAFGVVLLQPVDLYQQTERAVKYAALFIVTTFVIAFLWEVGGSVLVHPVQYLFVGFAMCIFYLLLLSLAEHVGFDVAYTSAVTATVVLLGWYWSWVLGGRRQGVLMGVALVSLYGFLYLLLRLEDYALLAGSVGLFALLAIVLYTTRQVNWYELRLGAGARESKGV